MYFFDKIFNFGKDHVTEFMEAQVAYNATVQKILMENLEVIRILNERCNTLSERINLLEKLIEAKDR
jgi:hypothetical protein